MVVVVVVVVVFWWVVLMGPMMLWDELSIHSLMKKNWLPTDRRTDLLIEMRGRI